MKWAALLALTGLVGCGRATPPEEAKAEPAAGTPSEITLTAEQIAHGGVRWSAAVATPLADFVELTGRLVVDEDHTARLSPSVKGRVTAVRANLGDVVSRGQTLVILQSEEASARRAELAKASAELTERQATETYARAVRERAERLLALKAGSAQDVERARTDQAAAEAGLRQAESEVEHARAALSVLEVDAATGQIQLASPIAGVVIARDAVAGAVIDAGVSALIVTDLSSLWLEFGAPDQVANRPHAWSARPLRRARRLGALRGTRVTRERRPRSEYAPRDGTSRRREHVQEIEARNVCDGARRDGCASPRRHGAARRRAARRRATVRVPRATGRSRRREVRPPGGPDRDDRQRSNTHHHRPERRRRRGHGRRVRGQVPVLARQDAGGRIGAFTDD